MQNLCIVRISSELRRNRVSLFLLQFFNIESFFSEDIVNTDESVACWCMDKKPNSTKANKAEPYAHT